MMRAPALLGRYPEPVESAVWGTTVPGSSVWNTGAREAPG